MVGKNQYQSRIKGMALRLRQIRVGGDKRLVKIVARTVAIKIGLLRIREVAFRDQAHRLVGVLTLRCYARISVRGHGVLMSKMSKCTPIGRLNLGCGQIAPTGADVLIGTNKIGSAWREVISFFDTSLEIENMVNKRDSEIVC